MFSSVADKMMRDTLAKSRIVLVSDSPRPKQILENIGLTVELVPPMAQVRNYYAI